uniref:Ig-like domain-containing protein n=1 Tax=Sarcophilus harrisii TaxID=9305 RepID=A0A7N4V256_SARHA
MAWPLVCLLLLTCCSGSFSQPVLTQAPSMSASLGATARLTCTLSSQYNNYGIAWQQQSPGKAPRYLMYVSSSGSTGKGEGVPDRFSGSASGADRYLSISNIQAEDEADYYCQTYGSSSYHRATFSEEVGQKPPLPARPQLHCLPRLPEHQKVSLSLLLPLAHFFLPSSFCLYIYACYFVSLSLSVSVSLCPCLCLSVSRMFYNSPEMRPRLHDRITSCTESSDPRTWILPMLHCDPGERFS